MRSSATSGKMTTAPQALTERTTTDFMKDETFSACGGRSGYFPGRAGRIAGSREGSHKRRRRHCSRPPTAPYGRGGRCHTAHWRTWTGDTIGCVRGTPDAHRLLLHVAHRPPGAGAVRGVHLLYIAGPRAVQYPCPRRHLCHGLPRSVRRERPVPRLHGLGDALVLGRPGLARNSRSDARWA